MWVLVGLVGLAGLGGIKNGIFASGLSLLMGLVDPMCLVGLIELMVPVFLINRKGLVDLMGFIFYKLFAPTPSKEIEKIVPTDLNPLVDMMGLMVIKGTYKSNRMHIRPNVLQILLKTFREIANASC